MIYRFGQGEGNLVYPDRRTDLQRDNPLYQAEDAQSHDIAVVHKTAQEMIRVNGASIKLHPRTRNDDVDRVLDEDADPTYWPAKFFKAFFVPNPMEYELTLWGADLSDLKTEIVFYRGDLVDELGSRLVQIGDIIEIPYNSASQQNPKYFRVDNAQETGNFRYTWLYLTCQTTLTTGDPNIRPHLAEPVPIADYPDPGRDEAPN